MNPKRNPILRDELPASQLLLLAGILGLFQLWVSWPVLSHQWVYFDDDINVVMNPHLTGGSWDTVKWAWTDLTYIRRYIPLGWMLFDGLFAVDGLNPLVFHTASWVLAAVNAVLLFQVARIFIRSPDAGTAPANGPWPNLGAALVAALYAVHPLQAESVGWVAGLVYLAGQCLASLAVLAALDPRRARWLSPVLFLFSLLVHAACLSLPVVMILAEGARGTASARPYGRDAWLAAGRKYAGWLALSFLAGLLNLFAAATSHTGFSAAGNLGSYPWWSRVQHVAAISSHYAGRVVWPGMTSIFYGTPAQLGEFLPQRIIALGLALVALGLLIHPRTRRATVCLGALLAASLFPFLGMFDQDQAASDRYVFMALAVLAVAASRVIARIGRPQGQLMVAAGLVGLLALAVPAYRSSLSAWRDVDSLQARVDAVTAGHPNAQLSFARPAIVEFLRGRFESSRQRLAAGQAKFGPVPEIVSAGQFIAGLRTSLGAPEGQDPSVAPWVIQHLNLAKEHQRHGHTFAAETHLVFAYKLTPAGSAPLPAR